MVRGPPNYNSYHHLKGDGKIQSLIPWVGGKQALCRAIISRFPADFRERTYVEVFGGGASVLLNKERSAKEVYNDFNSNLVNLFRVVREHPKELQARLRYRLNSREDFDAVKARLARGHYIDPILWAADFYQLIRQSYGGGGTSFGGNPRSMWASFPLIDAVAERFQYFALYYHPADKPDSQQMRQIKAALNLTRPIKYDRGLAYQGSGWAGPMVWEQYGGAQGIADKIEFYLLEMHPYATGYYLTEPQPGVFYLLY